jgi:two-component system phosphate regulon sensor histidine kinase PhoR
VRRLAGIGSGAPIVLILAFVFPTIVAAALALAYYGFQYADRMSGPVGVVFRDNARDEAEKAAGELEMRIDREALTLFNRLAAEKKEPTLLSLCDVDPGLAIEAYVVLRDVGGRGAERPSPTSHEECRWPAAGNPSIAPSLLAKLDWSAIKLASWHHFHDLVDGKPVLVVYTPRKADDEQPYYVAARFKMNLVRSWLDELVPRLAKNHLRVAIMDEDGTVVTGDPGLTYVRSERDERFLYEDIFGKALYRWRMRIVPQNVDEFQIEAERQKRLRPLLIVLSTTILAVGLGIIWLVILAERRASRLKSDFIANVSHELKTPLSLIRMFGEMVATGRHKGEGAAREYGAIITRESERLSHLIDNVLDFARLERGKASYHFAEGDLGEVLERALDVCRYRVEKEKLKLRTTVEPDLPPVRMDDNAMTLVILNLVDNAIKYGADGGQVDVALRRTPGGVVLGVRDYGPGIDTEEQARIFERFYRARTARDRNVRGSGIGLALVKYIAEAHGGRVTVDSPPPAAVGEAAGGALFCVFVPAPVTESTETVRVPQPAGAKP